MLSSQHLFSHQQQFQSADWPQSRHHPTSQQHYTHAVAAQHQHQHQQQQHQQHQQSQTGPYGRFSNNNSAISALASTAGTEMNSAAPASEGGLVSEENRKVLEWIAQLMKPETRETALLELSKKREQVPELALILWHSFGKHRIYHILLMRSLFTCCDCCLTYVVQEL